MSEQSAEVPRCSPPKTAHSLPGLSTLHPKPGPSENPPTPRNQLRPLGNHADAQPPSAV
ncbi:hypothetical protein T484DRAFT_1943029 [Baffinella frigidus]|nr:hypothetical protein T484DRAFT_1943029 [Cryptophyta sp. CCMP2293]